MTNSVPIRVASICRMTVAVTMAALLCPAQAQTQVQAAGAQPAQSAAGAGPVVRSSQGATAPRQATAAPAPELMDPRLGAGGTRLVTETVQSVAPLSPEEVVAARRMLEERRAAAQVAVSGPAARPTTVAYNIDLSPGSTPPIVRIDRNQGSIVSFLDSAGRPWPARLAENFAASAITVAQFSEHQISIGLASGPNTIANAPVNAMVAVSLEGLPTAITFTVLSQQSAVDTQVNLVVPRYRGDNPASVGMLRGEPSLTAGDLMGYLLRTPPPHAKRMEVIGLPGAMAWQSSPNRMVLRTTELVATGYFRQQGLGDGMMVYEMPLSPIVRVASKGEIKAVRITAANAAGQGGQ